MEDLFARIDAEPARARRAPGLGARIAAFFDGLTPRTLAWASAAAVLAIVLQAGLIGVMVSKSGTTGGYETASAPTTAPGVGAFTIIRFAPQATMDDITKFLDANRLAVTGGPAPGGMYRVRVAVTGIPKAELEKIVKQLQQNKTIEFIAPVE
jgi:hypothetical protein